MHPAIQPSKNPSIQDWFKGRAALRREFLARHGWGDAKISSVGEDCAFRRYVRLRRGEETAILMEAVPDGEAIATPGHALRDFVRKSVAKVGVGFYPNSSFVHVDVRDKVSAFWIMS